MKRIVIALMALCTVLAVPAYAGASAATAPPADAAVYSTTNLPTPPDPSDGTFDPATAKHGTQGGGCHSETFFYGTMEACVSLVTFNGRLYWRPDLYWHRASATSACNAVFIQMGFMEDGTVNMWASHPYGWTSCVSAHRVGALIPIWFNVMGFTIAWVRDNAFVNSRSTLSPWAADWA